MSGICGIVRFDRKPVNKEDIQKMLDSMKNRGNDAEEIWTDGNIGFGHKMLWTTPESLHENQPLISKDDNLILTADARIDNRDELFEKLEINEKKFKVVTDIDLILWSYQKWGEDCPKYLIGNFAFSIWDDVNKKIYCARDHVGFKPFVYYKNSEFLIFSSEVSALFSYHSVPKQINQEAIECSLLFDAIPYTHTYFKDVLSLKGSNYQVCNLDGTCRVSEYWNPADEQRIRNISFKEASLELKSIYKDALTSRLRSSYPISFELSGGLDSSSVVAYADQIGIRQPSHIYSLRFGNHACDEGKYIDEVCQVINQESTSIRADLLDYEHEHSLKNYYLKYSDWPMDLFFIPHFVLINASSHDQSRVMLTGQGGDEILQGSRLMLADFIGQGHLVKFYKQIISSKYMYNDIVNYTLRPLIPGMLRGIKQALRHGDKKKERILYQKYSKKVGFSNRNYKLRSSRQIARMIFGAEHSLWCNMNGYNLYGNYNIEARHPLFDIRLIRFSLTTPPEYFYKNSKFKFLFRDSIKGIIPEIIRERDDKVNFDEIVKLQLQAEIKRNPSLHDIDSFNIKKLINNDVWNLLEKFHAKRGFKEDKLFLHWKLVNLEYWYKRNFMID